MKVPLKGGPFDGQEMELMRTKEGDFIDFPGIDGQPEPLNDRYRLTNYVLEYVGEMRGFGDRPPAPEYARESLQHTLVRMTSLRLSGARRIEMDIATLEAMLVLLLER